MNEPAPTWLMDLPARGQLALDGWPVAEPEMMPTDVAEDLGRALGAALAAEYERRIVETRTAANHRGLRLVSREGER